MNQKLATMQELVQAMPEYGDTEAVLAFGEEDSTSISYADFAARVDALARGLRAAGVNTGEHVALLAPTQWETLAAVLAVMACGATAMPVDMQFGEEQLTHVLSDAKPVMAICVEESAGLLDSLGLDNPPRLVRLDLPDDDPQSLFALSDPNGPELPRATPEDQAALFYTSGTTGPPKGVPLTHGNLAYQMNAVAHTGLIGPGDRLLLPLPLHHVYPFVIGIFAPFSLGLTTILPAAFTGPQVVRAMSEGRVSVVIGVPRLYAALISGIESRVRERGLMAKAMFDKLLAVSIWTRKKTGLYLGKHLFKSLHERFGQNVRITASGGSALDPQLAQTMEGLGWRVAIGYGLTETSPILTINPPGAGRLDTVGKPIPGVNLRIEAAQVPDDADDADGKSPQNDHGEVHASGPGVFGGYRGLPEKTEEALYTDEDGAVWFRTGDLGALDADGNLELFGRASTLIVTQGGENVQPEPIEAALDDHPAIAESGVLERGGKLAAVLVPDEKEVRAMRSDPMEVLREAVGMVSRKLPSYMRPTELAMSREPIPRTRLGKIRRHLLVELFERARAGEAEQTPESLQPMAYETMDEEAQELLDDPAARKVWDHLAEKHPRAGMKPDSHLQIDLGVDSLEWLTLTLEIRSITGVELSEQDAASVETVRDLLATVREREGAGERQATAAETRRENPVTNPEAFLSKEDHHYLEPIKPWQRWVARFMLGFVKSLFKIFFRLEVRGLENLKRCGQCVVTPNHVSYLDPFAVISAMDFPTLMRFQFAAWTGAAFANRFNRFFARLARAVPIDPDRGVATSLALGSAAMHSGSSMVWFPEGVRSRTCQMRQFRPGLGLLLKKHGLAMIPTYIGGTCDAMPVGRFFPKPAKITVIFGEPVSTAELLANAPNDGVPVQERIMRGLRDRVAALGKALHEESERSGDAA
ncbi:MAG: AMP-binding protein [Oceanidesulfovibrio sp.]